ncbi:hypothetical protein CAPTEDRAFT_210004 [Capitella teleta]|uniref:Endonuclease/exonuclease/phosphatase domain-containing protein n=1 Tax=Capitella teleta TaxID=283909 RepID=R7V7E9_CAPTE|nr:hypothetical protein CAPTEDRAFT_210004 [Capitella teleta]|eukprot:ELU14778.1 hypothetical protein CAPTEDRAFT_210004 [Capitella teleta]
MIRRSIVKSERRLLCDLNYKLGKGLAPGSNKPHSEKLNSTTDAPQATRHMPNGVVPAETTNARFCTPHRRTGRGHGKRGTTRVHSPMSAALMIVSLNPWSVCNKTTSLSDFIIDHEIDILCLTETWLTGSEKDDPIIAELVPNGYNIRHTPRESRGGGTAIIHRRPRISRSRSFIETVLDKPQARKKTVSYRSIKRIDPVALKTAISHSHLADMNSDLPLEKQVCLYDSVLGAILNEMAPLKTKTITSRTDAEWYNEQIREAKQGRRRAERRWRGSQLQVDKEIFIEHRHKVNKLIDVSKRDYYRNLITSCSDSKQLFRVLNQLLGRKREAQPPEKNSSRAG